MMVYVSIPYLWEMHKRSHTVYAECLKSGCYYKTPAYPHNDDTLKMAMSIHGKVCKGEDKISSATLAAFNRLPKQQPGRKMTITIEDESTSLIYLYDDNGVDKFSGVEENLINSTISKEI